MNIEAKVTQLFDEQIKKINEEYVDTLMNFYDLTSDMCGKSIRNNLYKCVDNNMCYISREIEKISVLKRVNYKSEIKEILELIYSIDIIDILDIESLTSILRNLLTLEYSLVRENSNVKYLFKISSDKSKHVHLLSFDEIDMTLSRGSIVYELYYVKFRPTPKVLREDMISSIDTSMSEMSLKKNIYLCYLDSLDVSHLNNTVIPNSETINLLSLEEFRELLFG